ncbi:Cytochrome P450 [Arabidopsis thaliana x Arabidopsis arenosa]|uniref:Cytochrome P450 n=1 Tax=Arabidopsis thaliana x Arabidopsis arenosa TaxID=1240361 RepID=A0A8T1XXE6_9BRAS|nr:Cytochrome P450 [Arabidopsis thaliana x Arabidopsis arenosa]
MIDLFLLALIAGFITVAYLFPIKANEEDLTTSPVGFLVIGHLHLLKEPIHRSLRDLSRNLRSDVFFPRLGSRRAVVVTSASAAEEFLSQENDVIFANRPLASLTEYMGYNCTIVSAALYGEHWRRLRQSEPEHYTDDIIKGLVQVMLLAGTDTTAVTLEWAMANLLNHPEVLMKLKTELNNVSVEGRLLEESDTGKCPYLTNVISETLRLYPAAPLLVPHASSADCEVAGFDIPRGTWLFVNAWAIQRDPKVWDDPEAFKPERFESETHRGKYLPSGIGRRACPGMGLAQLVLSLALGSLIQCFDWERDNDVAVDMSEGRGITMPKAVPLVAKCKKSLPILDKVVL